MLRGLAITWFCVVIVVAYYVRFGVQPLPQEFIDAGIKLFIEQNRSREPVTLTNNGETGVYRQVQSSEELFLYYPSCCSFNTYDPERPRLGVLTRLRYDIRGFVFVKAGRVKASGSGPDLLPPKDTVFILNGEFEDVYSKVF